MDALLQVRQLEASYGNSQVLKGIDFSVARNGITAILGANGAGKTTTLRALSGLISRRGEVIFDGRRIEQLATEKIAAAGIAHVPDGRGTLMTMSVEENLRVGAYLRSDKARIADDFERIYGYFPRLRERRGQQAGTLSGGEQQMLAISRALMLKPRLLMMDEPSFGLAPLVIQEIFQIMRTINQKEGVSILLVEQNVTHALRLADDAYLIETGMTVMSGTPQQLLEADEVRRSYLGA